MKTQTLFEQLQSHTLVGTRADYARAHARQPALAAYATPADVVDALRRRAPTQRFPKHELVAALLVEVKAGACSLQEVLLQGFLPRLVKIRGDGQAILEDVETLEPLLAAAFVEAIAAYVGQGAGGGVEQFLVDTTRRLFLDSVQTLHEAEASLDLIGLKVPQPQEAPVWSDPPLATGAPIESANDPGTYIDEASLLLERLVGDRVPAERLAVVEATVVHDETLHEYVDRRFPGLNRRVRSRAQGKLRRQRNRTLQFLRRAMVVLGAGPEGIAG